MTPREENRLQRFIRQITTAAANASLYHPEHPQVLHLCLQALEDAKHLQAEHGELTLKLIDNQLIHAGQPVDSNLSVERMIAAFKDRGIGHLRLETGVCSEEVLSLVKTLSKRPGEGSTPRNSEHIRYGKVVVRFRQDEEPTREFQLTQFAEVPDYQLDKFMEIYRTARKSRKLHMVGIAEIVSSFVTAMTNHGEAFLALAPLRSMDEYTYTHSTNICLLNLAQARLLGISGPMLIEIGTAAMLHDVGKMFISSEILNKAGKLDKEEWEQMQQHPLLGAEYLLNSPGVSRLAVITAYEHHMRYDGQGYPPPPAGWTMNVCSYMTTISDFYDALRTRRSYRDALPFDQIGSIMLESAGTALHPELTHSFLQALDKLEKN